MVKHFDIDTSSAEFKQCCNEYNELLKKKGKDPLSFKTYVKLIKATDSKLSKEDKQLRYKVTKFIRYRLDNEYREKERFCKSKAHIQRDINNKADEWQKKWDSKSADEKKRLANKLLASLFSDMAEDIDNLYEAYKDKYVEQDEDPALSKTRLLESIESQVKKWNTK